MVGLGVVNHCLSFLNLDWLAIMLANKKPQTSYAQVIEFQKRGLPHVHLLLILKRGHKLTPEHFDQFISAEIPDEKENPHLYAAVLRHMMHGPCGKLNPSNVCFFIDGPGGTGKTFLYRALLATIRSTKSIALATATSGVAASILPNGRTALMKQSTQLTKVYMSISCIQYVLLDCQPTGLC